MRLIDADELVAFIKANGYVYANAIESFETFFDGITKERMREIARAEAEGRCVVLPCKIGTPVYWMGTVSCAECPHAEGKKLDSDGVVEEDCRFDCPPGIESWPFSYGMADEIGSEYFLTPEAATKAALDKRGEDAHE